MARKDNRQYLKGTAMATHEQPQPTVTETTTQPTATHAPAEVAQPQPTAPEIKVGTVVNTNEQALSKPANAATLKSIATQSTATPVKAVGTDWEQYLERLTTNGTHRQKYLITHLNEYITKTGPGSNISTDEQIRQEEVLWRVLKNIVETEDGFTDCFKLLIQYFRQHKNGVFHEAYLFRNFTNLRITEDEGHAYLNLVNLVKAAAGVNNLGDLKKIVNLDKAITHVFSEEARGRILNYFNN